MALTNEARKELLFSIEENQLILGLYDTFAMKTLLVKMRDMADEYNNLSTVKTMEELHFKRGQLDILKWLLSYDETVRSTLENLVEIVEKEVIHD